MHALSIPRVLNRSLSTVLAAALLATGALAQTTPDTPATAATAAEEWSQYRGPDRNGQATMLRVPEVWPDQPREAWKVEVGEGFSSPVVSGERIYLITRQGEDEVVMSLDLASGKTVWKRSFPTPYTPNGAAGRFGKGPRSTPVVAEGVACFLGVNGRFSCHDARDGKELWVRDFSERARSVGTFCGSALSPLVDGGVVFVHLGDDQAGRFFAADLRTGKELWGWEGQGTGYASPVLVKIDGKRQVVTFAATDLMSFDAATGEVLWKRPYPDQWKMHIPTPLVVGERILISDSENGTLSLRPKQTAGSWQVEEIWHNKALTQHMASPVTDGQVVFGFSNRRKGQLFVLDPESGKVLWEDEGRGGENAVLAMAGDWLLVTTTDATLRVMRWRDDVLSEVKRYKVASGAVWAEPGWLSDGFLVKDARHLARLSFGKAAVAVPAAGR